MPPMVVLMATVRLSPWPESAATGGAGARGGISQTGRELFTGWCFPAGGFAPQGCTSPHAIFLSFCISLSLFLPAQVGTDFAPPPPAFRLRSMRHFSYQPDPHLAQVGWGVCPLGDQTILPHPLVGRGAQLQLLLAAAALWPLWRLPCRSDLIPPLARPILRHGSTHRGIKLSVVLPCSQPCRSCWILSYSAAGRPSQALETFSARPTT